MTCLRAKVQVGLCFSLGVNSSERLFLVTQSELSSCQPHYSLTYPVLFSSQSQLQSHIILIIYLSEYVLAPYPTHLLSTPAAGM